MLLPLTARPPLIPDFSILHRVINLHIINRPSVTFCNPITIQCQRHSVSCGLNCLSCPTSHPVNLLRFNVNVIALVPAARTASRAQLAPLFATGKAMQ
jgi:hypothetical protein